MGSKEREERGKIGEFNVHGLGLKAIQAEYKVPISQSACGLMLAMEEAKDRQLGMEMGTKVAGIRSSI